MDVKLSNGTKSEVLSSGDYVALLIATDRERILMLDQKRFKKDTLIKDLKWRLEILTGRNCAAMQITLLSSDHRDVCKILDDNSTLSSYPVKDGMVLLVEDPTYSEIEGNVEDRYKLTDEEYYKRSGTLHEFLKKNRAGKFNPVQMSKMAEEQEKEDQIKEHALQKDKEKFEMAEVGARCEVRVPFQPPKRGTVMFKGTVNFQPGLWIGVKYDEPYGKNDGSVNGVRYFECPQNYGGFVKPSFVETGDFPELCELDEIEF